MDTKTFNQNYEVDRKAKGVRATAKNTVAAEPDVLTADSSVYDAARTYFFFDESTKEVRPSTGLRRNGEFLSTFGLRVVAIGQLRTKRDNAFSDGQMFFKSEIEQLNGKIKEFG